MPATQFAGGLAGARRFALDMSGDTGCKDPALRVLVVDDEIEYLIVMDWKHNLEICPSFININHLLFIQQTLRHASSSTSWIELIELFVLYSSP